MLLYPIASGSSGNCFYLELEGSRILLDLGIRYKHLCCALEKVGATTETIDAVLITHTHSDHVAGLPVTLKHVHCPIYLSVLSNAKLTVPDAVTLYHGRPVEIAPGILLTPFETSHDCPGSMGFRIDGVTESFGYATDLGVMTKEIRDFLTGVRYLVLESNHDEAMLKSGPYPFELKRRILSDRGHLSNRASGEAAAYFADHGTEAIFLAHLSQENNLPNLARETVSAALQGKNVRLEVLRPFENDCCLLD